MPFGSNVVIDRIVPNSRQHASAYVPEIASFRSMTLKIHIATNGCGYFQAPAGEPVHVTILRRDEQFMSFSIRSGSDFGTGRCQCEINPSL